MIRKLWRSLAKSGEFTEGARLRASDFRNVPFSHDYNNLARMYELRSWYVQNSPHKHVATQYSTEMGQLQHEINFHLTSLLYKRVYGFLAVLLIYWNFFYEEENFDWHGEFDHKYNRKSYGGLEEGVVEGSGSDE